MMASVTEEEANSRLGNWLRQRSRWIKGYCQTWLVHMRSPGRLWRELGPRRFLSVQATLGMATVTTLVNPFFWALTVLYLVNGPARISALFPMPVLYLGVLAMLVGNLLMVYCLMLGCMERGLFRALRAQLAVPVYWVMMSAAAYKALYQLLESPASALLGADGARPGRGHGSRHGAGSPAGRPARLRRRGGHRAHDNVGPAAART